MIIVVCIALDIVVLDDLLISNIAHNQGVILVDGNFSESARSATGEAVLHVEKRMATNTCCDDLATTPWQLPEWPRASLIGAALQGWIH